MKVTKYHLSLWSGDRCKVLLRKEKKKFLKGTAGKRGRTANHGAQSCAFPRRDETVPADGGKKNK